MLEVPAQGRIPWRPARGFTLIELLIALVVLMIGVYAMFLIFPRGHAVIEASIQQTTAAQLADAELARWKLDPETLADAVVATDYTGNAIAPTLTNAVDTTARPNLTELLVYGDQASLIQKYPDYHRLALSPGDIQGLDKLSRPFIYSPTDLTPTAFDGAQRPKNYTDSLHDLNLSSLHPNWEPNSLYLPRTIIGERVDLRSLPQTGLGVPFYLLSHAPLDVLRCETSEGVGPEICDRYKHQVYFDVYDARAWRYVPGYDPAHPDTVPLKVREFSVSQNQLYFGPTKSPPAQERRFKVDYTDLATRLRAVGATVVVAAGTAGPGIWSPLPPSPVIPDPATMQVYQRLRQVSDPSLLTVTDATALRDIYYVDQETTVSGRIQFPVVLQVDPQPDDMSVVKVDYRVADWQVLVFDIQVPTNGTVELPVRNLKSAGYTNPPRQPRPQEIARGIRRFYNWAGLQVDLNGSDISAIRANPDRWLSEYVNNPKTWAYVVAVDRQSGEILTDNELAETGGWPANPWMRRSRFNVNYRDGLLYFNYDPRTIYRFEPGVDTPNRGGRTYRVFCRAQNDWAVQLSLASRQYTRSRSAVPDGYSSYAWPVYDQNQRKIPTQILLPLNDTGHSVAVDYYTAGPNGDVLVEGEVHAASQPQLVWVPDAQSGQFVPVWACQLATPLTYEPKAVWGPTAVRGISVRARTTWTTTGRSATIQDLVGTLLPAAELPPGQRVARSSLQESLNQVIVTTYITRAPI